MVILGIPPPIRALSGLNIAVGHRRILDDNDLMSTRNVPGRNDVRSKNAAVIIKGVEERGDVRREIKLFFVKRHIKLRCQSRTVPFFLHVYMIIVIHPEFIKLSNSYSYSTKASIVIAEILSNTILKRKQILLLFLFLKTFKLFFSANIQFLLLKSSPPPPG